MPTQRPGRSWREARSPSWSCERNRCLVGKAPGCTPSPHLWTSAAWTPPARTQQYAPVQSAGSSAAQREKRLCFLQRTEDTFTEIYYEPFSDFQLTLVRWVTTTLFLTDIFPSWCWNIKCFLTPERSLQHNSHTAHLYDNTKYHKYEPASEKNIFSLIQQGPKCLGIYKIIKAQTCEKAGDSLLCKVCAVSTVAHHSIISSYQSVSRITWVSVTKAFSSGRYSGSVLYKCWSLRRETLRVNHFNSQTSQSKPLCLTNSLFQKDLQIYSHTFSLDWYQIKHFFTNSSHRL